MADDTIYKNLHEIRRLADEDSEWILYGAENELGNSRYLYPTKIQITFNDVAKYLKEKPLGLIEKYFQDNKYIWITNKPGEAELLSSSQIEGEKQRQINVFELLHNGSFGFKKELLTSVFSHKTSNP